MSFDVIATDPFARKLKKLAKKYQSLKSDLLPIIEELAENPKLELLLVRNAIKSV